MGCDIHLFVEVKKDGKWEAIDKFEEEDGCIYAPYEEQIYKGRNYPLFALLANVRNYSDVQPIHEPKGFPDDVSDVLKRMSKEWNDDWHSHSYLTIRELNEYDWEQPIKESGFVDNKRWKAFVETLKTETPDYMLRFPYAQGIGDSLKQSHTWHEWTVPTKITVGDFIYGVIKKLNAIGEPDDVRIVYAFDN